jgi:hypothetical protein
VALAACPHPTSFPSQSQVGRISQLKSNFQRNFPSSCLPLTHSFSYSFPLHHLPTKEYHQRKEETKLTIGPPLPNVVLHTLITVLSSNVTLSSQHQLNIFRRCGEDGREFCVCHDCGFFLFCAKDKGGGEGLARFGFLGDGTVGGLVLVGLNGTGRGTLWRYCALSPTSFPFPTR